MRGHDTDLTSRRRTLPKSGRRENTAVAIRCATGHVDDGTRSSGPASAVNGLVHDGGVEDGVSSTERRCTRDQN